MRVQRHLKKLVVVGAVAGIAVYLVGEFQKRSAAAEELAEETIENSIPTVSVVHATKADPTETITLPGNVEAWYQAPIYAQVSGYVSAWYKDYGAEVKKGDVLAQIQAPALSAQYKQAKAAMAAQDARARLAELTAQRFGAMRDSHALPEQQITVKEADARVADAEFNAAKQNVQNFRALMKFRTIVAPYDGIVIARNINVGDYVTKEGNLGTAGKKDSSNELFMVADIHKMRLFVSVPVRFGNFLKKGLQADVVFPQYPNRHFKADFLTVAQGFGVDTRTAVTEFVMDNEDHAIWPGSYATVSITATLDEQTLVVPATALVFQENGTELATLTPDHKVHFKPITVSRIMDSEIEVTDGITVDDVIIDNPSAALLEGDEVREVEPAPGFNLARREQSPEDVGDG